MNGEKVLFKKGSDLLSGSEEHTGWRRQMDLVLKLRELRRLRGLSQRDVARETGIGAKSISSFETGSRIDSLKFSQLERILRVYGTSAAEFFGGAVERAIREELDGTTRAESELLEFLRRLPEASRAALVSRFLDMTRGAAILASTPPPLRATR